MCQCPYPVSSAVRKTPSEAVHSADAALEPPRGSEREMEEPGRQRASLIRLSCLRLDMGFACYFFHRPILIATFS